ncbi:MAG: transporter [Bacteroidales bacterium]
MKKYLSASSTFFIRNLTIIAIILVLSQPETLQAQGDGARFYWKGLMGTNAIPVIANSMEGNANPFDPSHNVTPGSDFTASMSLAGYAKMLPLFKRSAMVSILQPMGRIAGDLSLNGIDYSKFARGFGDPMLQFGMNVIGPKPIMNIPDMMRYKPKFSVDIIGTLAIPIGEYDNTSPVNIGQNRWYGRIGTPVVWQIGSWVPGKRTTLEFLPAIWLFGDNNDFVGMKMETKPMYQLEGHLTRDFMERFWGSYDVISYSGGKATIDGVEGSTMNNLGMGGTLGYHVNDNLQLTVSYNTTINDKDAEDLKMDGFRITLIYGWHPIIEGMKRLNENE